VGAENFYERITDGVRTWQGKTSSAAASPSEG